MPTSRRFLSLTLAQRRCIEQYVAAKTTPPQVLRRCRIILAATEGHSDATIASVLGVSRDTVRRWRSRFVNTGVQGLWEVAPGRGRRPTYGADTENAVVDATRHTTPTGRQRWTCRLMATSQGVSTATVSRIWQDHNLQPHKKPARLFAHRAWLLKLTDLIGLYLDPPEHAIVLCVNEPRHIRALRLTPPNGVPPPLQGHPGQQPYDHAIRGGIETLLTNLARLQDTVIRHRNTRHRHRAFLRFLRRIDRVVAVDITLHVIVAHTDLHTSTAVCRWLAQHPRFALRVVPANCNWLSVVARWLQALTSTRIRRSSFQGVTDVLDKTETFLATSSQRPHHFEWQASIESLVTTLELMQSRGLLPSRRPRRTRSRSAPKTS